MLFTSTRADAAMEFPTPVPLGQRDVGPVVVNGGHTLYFAWATSLSAVDIVVATRTDTNVPAFTAVRHVEELNTEHREQPTWVSEDGCRILYAAGDVNARVIRMASKSPP